MCVPAGHCLGAEVAALTVAHCSDLQEERLRGVRTMQEESQHAAREFDTAVARLRFRNNGGLGDKTNDILHVKIE